MSTRSRGCSRWEAGKRGGGGSRAVEEGWRDGGTRGERGGADLSTPVSTALCRPCALCPSIPWGHLPGTICRAPTLGPQSHPDPLHLPRGKVHHRYCHGCCLYRPLEQQRDSLTPHAHENTGCAELKAPAPRGVQGGPGGDNTCVLRCVKYLELAKGAIYAARSIA